MHALPPQQQHPLFNLQHDADPAADSCGGQVLLELGADGADVAVGAVHLQHSGGVHGVGWVIGWGGGAPFDVRHGPSAAAACVQHAQLPAQSQL